MQKNKISGYLLIASMVCSVLILLINCLIGVCDFEEFLAIFVVAFVFFARWMISERPIVQMNQSQTAEALGI